MADNVVVTAGTGTTVAADEVVDGTLGTVKVQYVKLMDGTLDSTTKISPATSGNQSTANTSLASIDGKVPALGQALAAASVPVILPSATVTTLTPPAAITNFANETGGNLAAIKADVDKIPSQGQALAAASMPVVLPSAQVTSLTPPTNTGYALDASLTTIDTDLKSNITLHAGTNAIGTVGSSTATGSAVPANAFYTGVNPQTALPTAATAGNLTGMTADKFGRAVVLSGAMRDIVSSQTTTISASTTETTIGTAVASTFLDLTAITVSNTSATAARVDFRDTTAGSVLFSIYVPAGDTRGISFTQPQPQTTVNTNWTAQSSASVTDLRVMLQFIKNK